MFAPTHMDDLGTIAVAIGDGDELGSGTSDRATVFISATCFAFSRFAHAQRHGST